MLQLAQVLDLGSRDPRFYNLIETQGDREHLDFSPISGISRSGRLNK